MKFIITLNHFICKWMHRIILVYFRLMLKVRNQEEKHVELLKAGKQAKHRLEELAPEIRIKGKGDYFRLLFMVKSLTSNH